MDLDAKKAIFVKPSRTHKINRVGRYNNVPRPHICQPSRQRTPVLRQAGTSKAEKNFAAKHAEAISVADQSPSVIAKNIAEIGALAKEAGKNPQHLKFLATICPTLCNTQEEAQKKFEEYRPRVHQRRHSFVWWMNRN